jgi:hypothetical protein
LAAQGDLEDNKQASAKKKKKFKIKGTHISPAQPQCSSQAEVFNKTLAKYMKNMVNESNLNWEWYLAPLMFCYNKSYHRIM